MSTVAEHYERHLAPIYVWMAGGAEAALAAGDAEIEALHLPLAREASVFDLGAGFGAHSIPLARRGAHVVAIDSSAELLRTLSGLRAGLPLRMVQDDLLAFPDHLARLPEAILCMGDTITHLRDFDAVESLVERVSAALPRGGTFVASFRDYSIALEGDERFIPVRSDDNRILTCFLEYEAESVLVHDIVHERTAEGWTTRVSHYRKLRLSAERLLKTLERRGLQVHREAGMRGMVRIVARKTR